MRWRYRCTSVVIIKTARKRWKHYSKVDVVAGAAEQRHWIELKQWLVGKQSTTIYGPGSYFGDPTGVGIVKDVEKLAGTPPTDQQWLLLLMAKNPGAGAWNAGLDKFNAKFPRYWLEAVTNPDDYPDPYFLGLLKVHIVPA